MDENSIEIRIEGVKAKAGVVLADFESFIDNFLSALRDYDRDQRGAPTKKAGHPEARAAAVTSFRLVAFRQGSGIATIEPEVGEVDEQAGQMIEGEPIQMSNLRSLLSSIENGSELSESVAESLERARRSVGDDGSVAIDFPGNVEPDNSPRTILIDAARLEQIPRTRLIQVSQGVDSISGRLHKVDFEPDSLAIRTSDGVDWSCRFPETLESEVEALVNRLVWVSGIGQLLSPKKGTMELESIRPIEHGTQTSLFAAGQGVSVEELAKAQKIQGPQGLNAVGLPDWTDADDAYLEALS